MKRVLCGAFAGLFCALCLSACNGGGIGEEGISKEEYEQIRIGMSRDSVNDIVGGKGERISEQKNGGMTQYVYKYQGEKSGYALITYESGFNELLSYQPAEIIAMEQHDLS